MGFKLPQSENRTGDDPGIEHTLDALPMGGMMGVTAKAGIGLFARLFDRFAPIRAVDRAVSPYFVTDLNTFIKHDQRKWYELRSIISKHGRPGGVTTPPAGFVDVRTHEAGLRVIVHGGDVFDVLAHDVPAFQRALETFMGR